MPKKSVKAKAVEPVKLDPVFSNAEFTSHVDKLIDTIARHYDMVEGKQLSKEQLKNVAFNIIEERVK